jgi:hypothetical protein
LVAFKVEYFSAQNGEVAHWTVCSFSCCMCK